MTCVSLSGSSVGLEFKLMDKVLCNWGRFGIALFPGSFPLSLRGYENEPGYEAIGLEWFWVSSHLTTC